MKPTFKILVLVLFSFSAFGQLTIEKIMQDPKWMGVSPSNVFWSEDSKSIYFMWNPDLAKADSLYKYVVASKKIEKVSKPERLALPSQFGGDYSDDFSKKIYDKNGDLFLMDCKTLVTRQLTNTIERESNPNFCQNEKQFSFQKNGNLFVQDLETGMVSQLTNFLTGTKKPEPKLNEQEAWLKKDQLQLFEILKERKDKKDATTANQKADLAKRPKEIYIEEKTADAIVVSPDLRFISYRLSQASKTAKTTIVPSYVTESGFTEDLPARTKVGAAATAYESFIYDTKRDSVYQISTKDLAGLLDKPLFYKDYPKLDTAKAKPRKLVLSETLWSDDAKQAVVVVRSLDNKDRWIMALNAESGKLKLIDRQHDEAWIAGPGIGWTFGVGTIGFIDNQQLYFQSESTGYSHLYLVDVVSGVKKALTSGKFEVQSVRLSRDKSTFFISTNEVHPGETHLYSLNIASGEKKQITTMTGGNEATLASDEKQVAVRFSSSNRPWELFLQENLTSKATQLTDSRSEEFKKTNWREPALIDFKARDGQSIYGRVYEPDKKLKNRKAVIFVHGAGYLQNAHKWWSQYFREYLFHNLLVEKGYTVLDIDYRASSGYGRDVRTGIYRFMGGKDLTDNVDGAKLLVENYGIDAKKIGIYGGSYGGFITLMALFTTPDVFAAGAALRPVTDWAAYNHGYTANILNEPALDSIAYRKSSPIYHAAGLKNNLLICHGVLDVNVHYQDAVRLTQRLIELKKDNWELASYPMEDHGFVEPSSWMDEYKRILKLFEEKLK
jgi:dipeptidyl aminopeptidase/acylaminoacyl peptidase